MNADIDMLLEPGKAYTGHYKEAFTANAGELFDSLVKKSGISVEENRRVAKEYRETDAKAKEVGKKLKGLKGWRTFLIVLTVIAVILCIGGFGSDKVGLGVVSILLAIGALVLIFVLLRPKIKAIQKEYDEIAKKATELYNKALSLVFPLFDYFESSMTTDLIQKTVPTLVFDKSFDMRRYDYLNGKYGLCEENGEETSTVGILSGEIIGNPFVFERTLNHRMGTCVYTGSLTIHWTTYTRDSKGNSVAHHHTQTLYASVTKPKPYFTYHTKLIYGNDAAPDLSFSRKKTHAETFSENKMKSYVKSKTKKIQKLAKKNVATGFTELGNETFDALFGALDRDHEVQFRLLFTPLAQKNLLELMRGGSPYGDDFDMTKDHGINIVASDHAQKWEFNIDPAQYRSYDVDICRQNFLRFNEEYFRSVYFDMAPLLAIPMYQQIKPKEYIYKESYHRNYTVREAEAMVNRMDRSSLLHPLSVTPGLLKTELVSRDRDVDKLNVKALSYRTVRRVDFIPKLGGDGRFHNVPVPWLLYIPLEQETGVELCSLDLSEREYRHSEYAKDTAAHAFYHSIFTTLGEITHAVDTSPDEADEDTSQFGEIVEKAVEEAVETSEQEDSEE